MIKIGLIGTQSMHAWSFAKACNVPDENGNYRFKDARVTAIYPLDDTEEHIKETMEKGNVTTVVDSVEELMKHCNAFMILQRDGKVHMKYAKCLIEKGFPVFIDKPICTTVEDIELLEKLANENNVVITGGSGIKRAEFIKGLKKKIENGEYGNIYTSTISYTSNYEDPYNGIFFYIPHMVETMLELFGYNPKSVKATYLNNIIFTVCVKYDDKMVNLASGCSYQMKMIIDGDKGSFAGECDTSDLFIGSVGYFIDSIENNRITKSTKDMTKNIEIIRAINKSIETGEEVIL